MIAEHLKEPKNYAVIIVPFLTLSGVFYHMGYWITFGINGLELISITQIVKSSVYHTSVFIICYTALTLVQINIIHKFTDREYTRRFIASFRSFGIFYMALGTIAFFIAKSQSLAWYFLLFGWAGGLPPLIAEIKIFKEYVEDFKLRLMLSLFFVIPFLSFCVGRAESKKIQTNEEFAYIDGKSVNVDVSKIYIDSTSKVIYGDRIKYLGITDEYVLFSGFTNRDIIYINKKDVNMLKFQRGSIRYNRIVTRKK